MLKLCETKNCVEKFKNTTFSRYTYKFEPSLNDDRKLFFYKIINYYVYTWGPLNIQSAINKPLLFYFLG